MRKILIFTAILICLAVSIGYAFVLGPMVASSSTYAPYAPSAPSATASGSTAITVSWTAPTTDGTHSAATSFDIYRSTTTGAETLWQTNKTSPYSDTGLTPSTAYYYKVAAVNSAGSTLSSEVTATTTASTFIPNAPTGLSGTAGDSSVALSWTAPVTDGSHSAATSYKLYRTAANGATGTETLLTSGIPGTSTTDSTAVNGSAYRYKVLATNAAGDGALSAEAGPYTPAASVGIAALTTTNFDYATSGAGSITYNSPAAGQVTIAEGPSAADAALLVKKTAVTRGAIKTYRVGFKVSSLTSTESVYPLILMDKASAPVPAINTDINSQLRVYLSAYNNTGSLVLRPAYIDTGGQFVTATTSGWAAGSTTWDYTFTLDTQYYVELVSTATTCKIRVLNGSLALLKETTTFNWSSVMSNSASMWVTTGAPYTNFYSGNNIVVTSYEEL